MDLPEAAATAATFLRAWLAEHPAPATPGAEDFVASMESVEPDGDDGLLATFAVSIPFRMGDMRAQRHIDAALHAMMKAHPALRSLRIEVTANTRGPDAA